MKQAARPAARLRLESLSAQHDRTYRASRRVHTLSAASIPLVDLPAQEAKRLPRYPNLPAVRIGRLAVDERYTGRSLGSAMLADAAAFALLVGAKNYRAVAFYRRCEFQILASLPTTLFLPIATSRRAR